MDTKSVYKISYGLYVLTASQGDKDNGCIINTLSQLTSSPMQISVTVNKANFTHDMIKATGVFNVSVIDTSADFHFSDISAFRAEEMRRSSAHPIRINFRPAMPTTALSM